MAPRVEVNTSNIIPKIEQSSVNTLQRKNSIAAAICYFKQNERFPSLKETSVRARGLTRGWKMPIVRNC